MREADRTFFRPLWRRLVLVGIIVVWTGLEWWNGDSFWGMLTSAALAYSVWSLILNFDPEPAAAAKTDGAPDVSEDQPKE